MCLRHNGNYILWKLFRMMDLKTFPLEFFNKYLSIILISCSLITAILRQISLSVQKRAG